MLCERNKLSEAKLSQTKSITRNRIFKYPTIFPLENQRDIFSCKKLHVITAPLKYICAQDVNHDTFFTTVIKYFRNILRKYCANYIRRVLEILTLKSIKEETPRYYVSNLR